MFQPLAKKSSKPWYAFSLIKKRKKRTTKKILFLLLLPLPVTLGCCLWVCWSTEGALSWNRRRMLKLVTAHTVNIPTFTFWPHPLRTRQEEETKELPHAKLIGTCISPGICQEVSFWEAETSSRMTKLCFFPSSSEQSLSAPLLVLNMPRDSCDMAEMAPQRWHSTFLRGSLLCHRVGSG